MVNKIRFSSSDIKSLLFIVVMLLGVLIGIMSTNTVKAAEIPVNIFNKDKDGNTIPELRITATPVVRNIPTYNSATTELNVTEEEAKQGWIYGDSNAEVNYSYNFESGDVIYTDIEAKVTVSIDQSGNAFTLKDEIVYNDDRPNTLIDIINGQKVDSKIDWDNLNMSMWFTISENSGKLVLPSSGKEINGTREVQQIKLIPFKPKWGTELKYKFEIEVISAVNSKTGEKIEFKQEKQELANPLVTTENPKGILKVKTIKPNPQDVIDYGTINYNGFYNYTKDNERTPEVAKYRLPNVRLLFRSYNSSANIRRSESWLEPFYLKVRDTMTKENVGSGMVNPPEGLSLPLYATVIGTDNQQIHTFYSDTLKNLRDVNKFTSNVYKGTNITPINKEEYKINKLDYNLYSASDYKPSTIPRSYYDYLTGLSSSSVISSYYLMNVTNYQLDKSMGFQFWYGAGYDLDNIIPTRVIPIVTLEEKEIREADYSNKYRGQISARNDSVTEDNVFYRYGTSKEPSNSFLTIKNGYEGTNKTKRNFGIHTNQYYIKDKNVYPDGYTTNKKTESDIKSGEFFVYWNQKQLRYLLLDPFSTSSYLIKGNYQTQIIDILQGGIYKGTGELKDRNNYTWKLYTTLTEEEKEKVSGLYIPNNEEVGFPTIIKSSVAYSYFLNLGYFEAKDFLEEGQEEKATVHSNISLYYEDSQYDVLNKEGSFYFTVNKLGPPKNTINMYRLPLKTSYQNTELVELESYLEYDVNPYAEKQEDNEIEVTFNVGTTEKYNSSKGDKVEDWLIPVKATYNGEEVDIGIDGTPQAIYSYQTKVNLKDLKEAGIRPTFKVYFQPINTVKKTFYTGYYLIYLFSDTYGTQGKFLGNADKYYKTIGIYESQDKSTVDVNITASLAVNNIAMQEKMNLDKEFSYRSTLINGTSTDATEVRVLNVLPNNQDNRGTNYQGKLSLEDVVLTDVQNNVINKDIYYTTKDIDSQTNPKTLDLTSSDWSKEKPTDASKIKGYVIDIGNLPKDTFYFVNTKLKAEGNKDGDTYVDTILMSTDSTSTPIVSTNAKVVADATFDKLNVSIPDTINFKPVNTIDIKEETLVPRTEPDWGIRFTDKREENPTPYKLYVKQTEPFKSGNNTIENILVFKDNVENAPIVSINEYNTEIFKNEDMSRRNYLVDWGKKEDTGLLLQLDKEKVEKIKPGQYKSELLFTVAEDSI